MISRIAQYIQRAPPKPPPDTYAIIVTSVEGVPVYGWVADRIARQVQRTIPPRWVTFRDIAGGAYTVRSSHIVEIATSSPAIRAAVRAFYAALEREREMPPE